MLERTYMAARVGQYRYTSGQYGFARVSFIWAQESRAICVSIIFSNTCNCLFIRVLSRNLHFHYVLQEQTEDCVGYFQAS